ncbi:hypothetical protein R1flu_028428 [Riccia fluitans]|uniref:RING-type domain-containing protein n=1 Tax=Riccia fluitans TaxID=41844 RepID=A0ABD1XLQ9_9MARC
MASVESMSQLERMGSELRCAICLSLFKVAVTISCNHTFCRSCILESLRTNSCCPVCKTHFSRREALPAPQMDSLVEIFRGMETSTGETNLSLDKEEQDDDGEQSMLGQQSYWDSAYAEELANFREHGDAGEIWEVKFWDTRKQKSPVAQSSSTRIAPVKSRPCGVSKYFDYTEQIKPIIVQAPIIHSPAPNST